MTTRKPARWRWPAILALALAAAGCGGGSGPGGGGGAGFTANVNGKAWAAEPIGVTASGGGVPGGLVIVGSQSAGNLVTGLTLNLSSLTGPGTYALGVGPGVYGGSASVGESPPGTGASNLWATALNGLAGQIVITTLSAGRIVASFQFTADAARGNAAGGTRTVTDGKIDLPITGTIPPVPDKVGSKVSAVLGGKPYNAWGVNGRLQDFMGGAGVAVDSHSSENALSLMLVGVTTPASYALSNATPLRVILAGKTGGDASRCCWGQNAGGDVGTINITSLTPTRVKGTFSGTLQPQPGKPATAPLIVTDGVFDVGID
jgi:hypothetical protein